MSVTEQQRANRLALADHLEHNVKDEQYNHRMFKCGQTCCAAGHAANIGIGGIGWVIDEWSSMDAPMLPGHSYLNSIITVFGESSRDIFYPRNVNRTEVIIDLRDFRKFP